MILLNTTDTLRVVLAGAVTTNQAVLYAAYADIAADASTLAPGTNDDVTNNTTSVNWVPAPSAGLRQVKYLSLYNADTATITATVSFHDGTNLRTLGKFTLLTGERLEYDNGFQVFTADGAPRSSVATAETGRHAVFVAAGAMTPSATGGCATLATVASAANQPDIQSLDFDSSTQEYAQFSIVMPESWNEGTLTFVPVWSHAATTTNFGVVWDMQAVAISNDDAIAVAFGTAQTSADTGGTTNDLYKGPESSAITVSGTPAAGDGVFFRVSRVTGNGSDTMAIDARLHGVVVYITTDAGND